jgi:ryanodine receptor 2
VKYIPRPIDTSKIKLSPELLRLTERLAENAHDIWARRRIAEGWTLGPRDDQAKTNPDLVPYSQLEDSEKQYDRDAVTEALKATIALGYKIEKA